jgi:hypothetical protein
LQNREPVDLPDFRAEVFYFKQNLPVSFGACVLLCGSFCNLFHRALGARAALQSSSSFLFGEIGGLLRRVRQRWKLRQHSFSVSGFAGRGFKQLGDGAFAEGRQFVRAGEGCKIARECPSVFFRIFRVVGEIAANFKNVFKIGSI